MAKHQRKIAAALKRRRDAYTWIKGTRLPGSQNRKKGWRKAPKPKEDN